MFLNLKKLCGNMTKSQKYLLDNKLDDVVLNSKEFPENTKENSVKWVYLSDVLEKYITINRRELLISAICQFTKRDSQKEILEVDHWLENTFKK